MTERDYIMSSAIIEALKLEGLDPWTVLHHPMAAEMANLLVCGEWTLTKFIRSCVRLAILNPELRSKSSQITAVKLLEPSPESG